VTLGRYLLGVLLAVIALVPVLAAARTLRGWLLPSSTAALARLAEAILGLSIVVVVAQVLGMSGWFRTAPMVAGVAAVGSVTWVVGRRVAGRTASARELARQKTVGADPHSLYNGRRGIQWVALAATSVLSAAWGAWTVYAFRNGMESIDTRWYHMPFAGRFLQTGSLTEVHHHDTSNLTAFFPFDSEVLHAFAVMVFGTDVLSPVLNLGWLALALLAGWCIGSQFGVALVTLMGTIALAGTPTMISTQSGAALTDIVGLALLLSAVAVLTASGARGRWMLGEVLVAGLAAGLAIGVKWTFLPSVGVMTIAIIALAARGSRLVSASTWTVGLALTGAFSYVRNLVVVGNPIPPLELGIGPLALPSPPQTIVSSSVSDFILDGDVWTRIFVPGLAEAFGLMWWALIALAITGTIGAAVLGPSGVPRMLGIVGLVALVTYMVQPQSLGFVADDPIWFTVNLRYAVPALGIGLVLLPLLPVLRGSRSQMLLVAVFGAIPVVAQFGAGVWPPGTGEAAGDWSNRRVELAAGAAIGIAVLATGALLLGRRRAGFTPHGRITGFAVAGALGTVTGGFLLGRFYLDHQYGLESTYPETQPVTEMYAWARDVHDARIGIVRNSFQYPLYGEDLSNHVQYVGRPGPNGSFDEITRCDEWREALNDGQYDYVLVSPPAAFVREPPEAMAWTEDDAAASVVMRHGNAVLFRLDGELDPNGC
jgi:hypothetical protein